MRLDLFLKLARLVKRRSVAQEMIRIGAVRINGREGKPSSSVHPGDSVEIAYPRRVLKIKVLEEDEKQLRRKAEAYEVQEERRVDSEEVPW